MADFRRYVLALVILALFAGLASAQVVGPGVAGPLTCSVGVAVTPVLRQEGFTEAIGDIVLTCTGGADLPVGSTIPTANITVFLNTAVTSRLLTAPTGSSVNASEALLMIDEPDAHLQGYGPAQLQNVNTQPQVGAGPASTQPQFVFTQPAYIDNVVGSVGANAAQEVMSSSSTSATPPINVYQGVINGSSSSGNVTGTSVSFNGVPILPPVSTGVIRVYRITNIRVNASGLSAGQPVIANISISGSTSLPIATPTVTTGFVQTSLSTAVKTPSGGTLPTNGVTFNQCQSQSLTQTPTPPIANNLQFTDLFATAFKTRVVPGSPPAVQLTGTQATGQSNATVQNLPGGIYNSESDFTLSMPNGGVAGLADYGTRLEAAFNNIPSGVTIWVTSVNTVVNSPGTPLNSGTGGVGVSGGVAPGTATPFAELVASSTISDNGFFPVTATNLPTGATAGVVALTPNGNGTALAVWEVVNTNISAVETFNFGVYITYTSNVVSTPATPAPGIITVNLSYAPISTQAEFAAAQGPTANALPFIPRFADTSTAVNAIDIIICRTILLFPYVVDVAGFDTGLAIENTSNDPFQAQTAGIGTKTVQSGTCTLYFDGQTVASASPPIPAPFTTGTVTTQTAFANTASVIAPGFDGYIIAICNFQYAHGLAFIGQLGNAVNGSLYLALIIPDPATTTAGRPAALPAAPSNAEQLLQ